jgi:hypothetical protein
VVSEAFLRVIGIWTFATFVPVLVEIAFAGALRRPGLGDLQLSGDPDTVKNIVQGPPAQVARLKLQLLVDYAFIALYWPALVLLAIAIVRRGGAGYDVAGLVAALAASATALLDVVENIRTRGLLALTRPRDQVRRQPVVHLRGTSRAKWAASSVTVALLSVFFLPGEGWLLVLGIAFLVVALLGLLGTLKTKLVTAYLLAYLVLGAALATWFTINPDSVLSRL